VAKQKYDLLKRYLRVPKPLVSTSKTPGGGNRPTRPDEFSGNEEQEGGAKEVCSHQPEDHSLHGQLCSSLKFGLDSPRDEYGPSSPRINTPEITSKSSSDPISIGTNHVMY
jgi:hypothetical protein